MLMQLERQVSSSYARVGIPETAWLGTGDPGEHVMTWRRANTAQAEIL